MSYDSLSVWGINTSVGRGLRTLHGFSVRIWIGGYNLRAAGQRDEPTPYWPSDVRPYCNCIYTHQLTYHHSIHHHANRPNMDVDFLIIWTLYNFIRDGGQRGRQMVTNALTPKVRNIVGGLLTVGWTVEWHFRYTQICIPIILETEESPSSWVFL